MRQLTTFFHRLVEPFIAEPGPALLTDLIEEGSSHGTSTWPAASR